MHAALQDQMGRSLLVMLDLIYIYVSARVYAEIFCWVLEGQLKAVLKESVVYLCVVTLLAIALSILLIDCKGRTFISIELRSSWGQVGDVAGRNHKSGKPGWIGIQKRKRTDGHVLDVTLPTRSVKLSDKGIIGKLYRAGPHGTDYTWASTHFCHDAPVVASPWPRRIACHEPIPAP